MSYIKEPYGVDFFVENKPVTEDDKKLISGIIAYYKQTGRKKGIAVNHSPTSGKIRNSKKITTKTKLKTKQLVSNPG